MRSLSLHGLFSLYINVTEKTMRSLVRSWDIHAALLPQKTAQHLPRYQICIPIWDLKLQLNASIVANRTQKLQVKENVFLRVLLQNKGKLWAFPRIKIIQACSSFRERGRRGGILYINISTYFNCYSTQRWVGMVGLHYIKMWTDTCMSVSGFFSPFFLPLGKGQKDAFCTINIILSSILFLFLSFLLWDP